MSKIDERKTELHDLTEQLRRDAVTVRDAYRRLRADEDVAWTRYVADVDAALVRLERDLEAERDLFAAQRAEQSAELREALRELLARVHGDLDDLRVQEALLEMEARDRFGEAWEAGQHTLTDLRAKLGKALDVVAFLAQ